MSKELQTELDRILADSKDAGVKKAYASFYLPVDLVNDLRAICVDKRKMSRTVEALLRDFVRQRQAAVVEMPSHPSKKLG